MKFDPKLWRWADPGLGAVLVVLTASSSSERALPLGVAGALWLALAWRRSLSLSLTAALFLLGSRFPGLRDIPAGDLWVMTLGLAPWAASVWVPTRLGWAGWGIGAMWGAVAGLAPATWIVAVCALPRLANVNPGRERAVAWSALLVGGAGMGWAMARSRTRGLFTRPGDVETYESLFHTLREAFTVESFWMVIAVVGLFEMARCPGRDHRINWRAPALLGVPLLFLFVPPERAWAAVLWIGFPASAMMLTRWSLALPHWIPRVCLGTGLLVMAFAVPTLSGGPS